MQIDCNNVSGSIGIYSTRCEEGSGPRDCVIQNWIVKGVFYSGSGCQNWEIYSLELFSGTAATTAIGIDIDTTASSNIIRDVTVNSINATQSTNPAIRIQNAVVNLYRIHVEYYDIGVNFGTGANGLIDGLVGHSTVVRLLQLDSGAMARDISQNSSTYAIWDTVRGYSGSMNGSSWYDLSNDGAAGIGKSARTSAAFAPSRENSPTTFGVTLTVDGAFGVTGSAAFNGSFFFNNFSGFSTVATGPTLTLGAGTMFGLSTAGATTISTITATGNTGRLAVFISKNGNAAITWNEAGNLQVNNTPYAMSDNEVAMFVCDGVTWYQMGAPTTT
jgi:hypothetical protein